MTENASKNSVNSAAQKMEGDNLWNNILKEASRSIAKRTEIKNIVILGDVNSGKSSLVSRIQKNTKAATTHKPLALDYSTIELFAESEDEPTLINVWELGDTQHADLLKYGLNSGSLHTSVAVICLDLSYPWTLSESLSKWLQLLQTCVSSAANELAPGVWNQLKNQGLKFGSNADTLAVHYDFQSQLDTNVATAKLKKKKIEEDQLRSLPEGTLTHNLGVPIVIVGCKSDCIPNLEKEYGFKDAHFEYISQHLRRLGLPYGAALMYTSSKNNINCDQLLEYLKHHLFTHEGIFAVQTNEKEQLFFPAGTDSLARINADFDNQNLTKDVEDLYEDIIKLPKSLQTTKHEIVAEELASEDHDFVSKYKVQWEIERDIPSTLSVQIPTNSNPTTSMGSSKSAESVSQVSTAPSVATATTTTTTTTSQEKSIPKKPEPSATRAASGTTQAEQEVLANFFNSLINKGGKTPLSGKPSREEMKKLLLSTPTIPEKK